MHITPDTERLSKLTRITESDIGKQIVFCPDCEWQLEPGTACRNKCPECGSKLHVSTIGQDLIDLIKAALKRKEIKA